LKNIKLQAALSPYISKIIKAVLRFFWKKKQFLGNIDKAIKL